MSVQKPSALEESGSRVRATPRRLSYSSCLGQVPGDEAPGPPLVGSSQLWLHHPGKAPCGEALNPKQWFSLT